MDSDKPLLWVGSAKEDLSGFPDDVKMVCGFALRTAQKGGKHPRAKALKGQGNAGLLEVVDDFDGSTYRAVYTISFPGCVYALHAFQKKSKNGRETPKSELRLIERRMKTAAEDYEKHRKALGNG